jgi:hypothetical protein
MLYSEIEDYLRTEKFEELLTQYSQEFTKIEQYSSLLKNGIFDNGKECSKALNELTALYIALKPVVSVADTFKMHEELKYYINKKEEIAKAEGEKKFVSAVVEREASLYVSNYRRVRNIFESYLEAVTQAIQSLQSILKFLSQEMILTPKA